MGLYLLLCIAKIIQLAQNLPYVETNTMPGRGVRRERLWFRYYARFGQQDVLPDFDWLNWTSHHSRVVVQP